MPRISVSRDTSYPDRLRAYSVLLDGQTIGSLKGAEQVEIDVAPGKHVMALKIDWCGSKPVDFTLAEGETAHFSARSNLTGLRVLLAIYYVLFAMDRYLTLQRVS